MGLIVVFAVENRQQHASAQSNPEKYITDLNGQTRTSFGTGESAYLTLRGYSEALSSSSNLADIMLVVDTTGSMNGAVLGVTKCDQAKAAATSFVNNVNTTFLTKVGLTTISSDGGHVFNYPMTLMDTDGAKGLLTTYINTISCLGGTPMGSAINKANEELSNTAPGHGRSGAQKYIVMLSDGGENGVPAVNGEWFTSSRASDPNYQYLAGSPLADSISDPLKVKYFTILYSTLTGSSCAASDDPTENSLGCSLMRYVAGKTNGIALPTETINPKLPWTLTWMSDYSATTSSGQSNGIDNKFFYKVAGEEELTNIYDGIIEYIQASSTSLNFYEKLSSEVQYDEVVSIRDKGRRWVGANKIETLSDGTIKFTLPKVQDTYSCDEGETACLNAASGGVITNNYVDLKIKITFTATGKFDLDSNYSGCDTGNPTLSGANSKVEYIDPRLGTSLGSMTMPAMCLNVLDSTAAGGGLVISKSTYLVEPSSGEEVLQSSFQAGDLVAVKIFVNEILPYRQNWKIDDTMPPSVSKITQDPTLSTPGSGNKATLVNAVNGTTLEIENRPGDQNTSLVGGINIIEYRYKI